MLVWRRLATLLAVMALTAACGGDGSATTTTTSTPATTGATTTTTAPTTTSTGTPDTGPLAPLLENPVADPLLDTGYHQMGYRDPAHDEVVSEDALDEAGTRLALRLPDPMPATTGLDADQMLLQASFTEGPDAPEYHALVLYGLGVGGWNPYVVIDYGSVLGYLETTTDYQSRRLEGSVRLDLTPSLFDWSGSARLVTGVAVFAPPDADTPAYTGEIECTFIGALECTTLSDDGILRPGDEGEAVQALQDALAQLGYFAGGAEGTYDDTTEEAVSLFQRDYRLAVDGKAGPQTLGLIDDVVSGRSDIVMASQEGVGEVLFGTPAGEARTALIALFGTPDSSTGWYASECSGDMYLELTWAGFTAIFSDREGARLFDGWHVDDLADLPSWLYFVGGIRPSWRWADFQDMGAGFDPDYGAFWYQHDLGYNNGRFVDPPADPPAATARIRSFGTGTGAFVSC